MRVEEIMTTDVIRVEAEESVSVAARVLEHYNIGALPVCTADGKLCGMLTDRDLTVRCMAANKPGDTKVAEIMTAQLVTVSPKTKIKEAAAVMGEKQVRRLPVVEQGKLCGIVSLGDIIGNPGFIGALERVSSTLSSRK